MENNQNQKNQHGNLEQQAAGEEQKRNFPGQGQREQQSASDQDAERNDNDQRDDEPAK